MDVRGSALPARVRFRGEGGLHQAFFGVGNRAPAPFQKQLEKGGGPSPASSCKEESLAVPPALKEGPTPRFWRAANVEGAKGACSEWRLVACPSGGDCALETSGIQALARGTT